MYNIVLLVFDVDFFGLYVVQCGFDVLFVVLVVDLEVIVCIVVGVVEGNVKLLWVEQIKWFCILFILWEFGGDEIILMMKFKCC